jgi:hypothetical protein
VRSNHVHSVVEAEVPPERVMSDFKAYASRRLNRMRLDESGRKRRARHGSTRDGCGNQGMSWLPSIMWLMTTLMLCPCSSITNSSFDNVSGIRSHGRGSERARLFNGQVMVFQFECHARLSAVVFRHA